ncbi:hypothetical protein [Aeoliella sp. SH292]|uniref:hypothetical protein n=1 Tax=Aeoliella sp. SH292 TaxID=3454464 RepID=UPI003F9B1993
MRKATMAAMLILACSRCSLAEFQFYVDPTYRPIPGHSTYDLKVIGTGTISTFTMRAVLERGIFYQHPLGSMVPPSTDALVTAPELAYDTFIGWGGLTQEETDPSFQHAMIVNDSEILATWQGGPSTLNKESLFLGRLTVPSGSLLKIQTLLEGVPQDHFYQVPVDTALQIVEGTPSHGSTISLQPGLANGTGVLERAIVLKDVHPHGEILPNVPVESLTFPNNDHDLFSAISNADDSSIDLVFDIQRAQSLRLKPGTVVNATLVVDPEFAGPLQYYLTATIVPEPSSFGLALAVTSLGCAWQRRR